MSQSAKQTLISLGVLGVALTVARLGTTSNGRRHRFAVLLDTLTKDIGALEGILERHYPKLSESNRTLSREFTVQMRKLATVEEREFSAVVRAASHLSQLYQKMPAELAELVAKTFSVEQELHDLVASFAIQEGMRLLATAVPDDESPSTYLQKQYRALYLLGRAGHQVNSEQKNKLFLLLKSLHIALDRAEDRFMIDWFDQITSGPSLPKRLGICPEVEALGVDERYIAFALGVEETYRAGNILADLQSHSWLQ